MPLENTEKVTHKTEAVMRLLTGHNTATNPVIDNEFKQNVIEMYTTENKIAEKNAKKIEKAMANASNAKRSGTEICVSSELITEILPRALKRFKCCTCDRCYAEAMADALDAVPYVSCRIRSPKDKKKLDEMRRKYRKSVTNEMVRIAISRRNLPKHKQTK